MSEQGVQPAPAAPKTVSTGLAIVCLILNLIIPGLGTIIGKRTIEGIVQIVLYVIGCILCFILIGIPIVIAVWVWALVDSILIISKSSKG